MPDIDEVLNDTQDTVPQVDESVDNEEMRSFNMPDQLRAILPANWNPGVDGLGKNI